MKYDNKKRKQYDAWIAIAFVGGVLSLYLAGIVAVVIILWKLVGML